MADQMEIVMELARRLGRRIAEHERTKTYLEAQQALQADTTANDLVQAYQKQAEKIGKLEEEGKPVEVDDKHRLRELETQMSTNANISAFMRRQVDYVEMMRKVWEAINEEIGGQDGEVANDG